MTATPRRDGPTCDAWLRRAFDLLGKRWNGVILGVLSHGPAGFSELRRAVGTITDSVLSDRLAELAAEGLVKRSVTDTRPPGVSYALTDAGAAILPVLDQLATWAHRNLAAGCDAAAAAAPRPPHAAQRR
jgi:DNA-binding HxlR family transcriptional regulator